MRWEIPFPIQSQAASDNCPLLKLLKIHVDFQKRFYCSLIAEIPAIYTLFIFQSARANTAVRVGIVNIENGRTVWVNRGFSLSLPVG